MATTIELQRWLRRVFWDGGQYPPYMLTDDNARLFTLAPSTDRLAKPPTVEEARLATEINRRVAGYRALLPAGAPPGADAPDLGYAFIVALREIAERGLCVAKGRDFAGQRKRFAALFESIVPPASTAPAPDRSGAFVVTRNVDGEIEISRTRGGKPPTDDQQAFAGLLSQSERFVSRLYRRAFERHPQEAADKIDAMQQRLQWAGQIALEGDTVNLKLATIALAGIEDDTIQDCGTKVRGRYLRDLARWYAIFGAVALAMLWGVHEVTSRVFTAEHGIQITTDRLVFVAASTIAMMLGAWLSAANRLQPSDKTVLENLLTETLSYWVRAAFVIGFGWFALLLLHKQVVRLDFGGAVGDANGFKTYLALQDLAAAILTGGFLGLAERAVPAGVLKRAETLAGALASK